MALGSVWARSYSSRPLAHSNFLFCPTPCTPWLKIMISFLKSALFLTHNLLNFPKSHHHVFDWCRIYLNIFAYFSHPGNGSINHGNNLSTHIIDEELPDGGCVRYYRRPTQKLQARQFGIITQKEENERLRIRDPSRANHNMTSNAAHTEE